MIVLLSCSTNSLANDTKNSSTGVQDSVLISYNDLRLANSKLIELEYEKDINNKLRQVIHNDSIIRNNLNTNIFLEQKKSDKYRIQRNIFGITSLITLVTTIIFIIK